MNATVSFTKNAYDDLLSDCRLHNRVERVGLLIGQASHVSVILPRANHWRGRMGDGFTMTRADLKSGHDFAVAAGLVVLGRYHTHLHHPPLPSRLDRLSLPPGWMEVIARIDAPPDRRNVTEVRAYRNGSPCAITVREECIAS
ncbi:Mov34/MPN/PAD-1 family protein [Loktanella sp. TSTF-M6]|uniref:Mov34/MPN/PAD-1 family protein n=1 Tax=Loktanella gaetbuli TaxID=2881335 RepID=A0ABS8BY80_9RHOB|nr:Mov34/MPN/PAD-1 family protein [Loktanella gaetbuli]MCB5200476.1 Mov34/MPN/PAD-1 family protein [Loktanella gaetbuli]